MTAEELMAWLATVPRNAKIVIGGEVVVAATTQTGKLRDGYYNQQFREATKGRETAVVFMHHTEFSDGLVGLSAL